MSGTSISSSVQEQVNTIVERFNQKLIQKPARFFIVRFRGAYVYLDRKDGKSVSKVGRLRYTGDMQNWDFAIYKYSSERYDPDEWLFPGSQHLDGTIEGALKACIEAYP